jgi:hypothetical protein
MADEAKFALRSLLVDQSQTSRWLGITAAGSRVLSPMANVFGDRPGESGPVAVSSRFRDGGGDMTIVDLSFARSFPSVSIYNIRGFAEIVNAPTPLCAPIQVACVGAERT